LIRPHTNYRISLAGGLAAGGIGEVGNAGKIPAGLFPGLTVFSAFGGVVEEPAIGVVASALLWRLHKAPGLTRTEHVTLEYLWGFSVIIMSVSADGLGPG